MLGIGLVLVLAVMLGLPHFNFCHTSSPQFTHIVGCSIQGDANVFWRRGRPLMVLLGSRRELLITLNHKSRCDLGFQVSIHTAGWRSKNRYVNICKFEDL